MTNTWGIHNDQPSINPLTDGAVRIGWEAIGDLSQIVATREAFKAAVARQLPELDEAKVPSTAGTLYRFVHELQVGDVVVCPNRSQRSIDIGTVSGAYEFHPDVQVHRHWRPVHWVRTGVARSELSIAAQNEIGSATTLFLIRTAEDEIAHLIVSPARDDSPDFSWTEFYPRLVDALRRYEDDRAMLLTKVWNVARASGRPQLFKYLQSDHYADGMTGPIRDVDPFTVLATFNRGIKEEARADIARAFGEEFGVELPPPLRFPGIPLVNNLSSWFFHWENQRNDDEIPALWELCAAAVSYAASATESTRGRLVSAFDACATGGTRKLTMALFWVRPQIFGAYDSPNTSYLKNRYPDLAARLSLGSHLDGEQFLANTETFSSWLRSSASQYNSFAEFSFAAWWHGLPAVGEKVGSASNDSGEVADEIETSAADELAGESYGPDSIREDGGFVPAGDLVAIIERLRSKKNIILQGPPGTGKTWLARRIGWALCDERASSRVQVLQFHPSLTYEDFVRGWRPTGSGLELADGPFLEMCTQATKDHTRPYVLVIEEINRGNPAQIFGELLTLMEADKRSAIYSMRLAYPRENERFFVPPNLHIIGTMNLADRSLAIVDMAFRRRFAFNELRPLFEDDWVQYVSGLGYDFELLEAYGARARNLNEVISADNALGRQYCVGHSYFTPAVRLEETGLTTQRWWHRVVETDVRPLLEEYWFDRPQLANTACEQLLGP